VTGGLVVNGTSSKRYKYVQSVVSLRKLSVAVNHVQYKLQQRHNSHGFDPQLDRRFKLIKSSVNSMTVKLGCVISKLPD